MMDVDRWIAAQPQTGTHGTWLAGLRTAARTLPDGDLAAMTSELFADHTAGALGEHDYGDSQVLMDELVRRLGVYAEALERIEHWPEPGTPEWADRTARDFRTVARIARETR